jgi:hypothetical protein
MVEPIDGVDIDDELCVDTSGAEPTRHPTRTVGRADG